MEPVQPSSHTQRHCDLVIVSSHLPWPPQEHDPYTHARTHTHTHAGKIPFTAAAHEYYTEMCLNRRLQAALMDSTVTFISYRRCRSANHLTLNSSKTEFLLIGLKQQLAKISSCSLDTAHSARNLGFIFDEHIFSDQISALSKSCYSHICQLRCIRPHLDHKTASTIATSIVYSKLGYCNSLYYNLPNT